MDNKQVGFTLIELLVVIAIIGILAALVLVALGNARDKANDARIKSDIGQLRTLAEVFYDSNGGAYVGGSNSLATCFDTPSTANCVGGIENSVTSLKADLVTAGSGTLDTNADSSRFCISDSLKSDTTQYVCVDTTGVFKAGTAESCGPGFKVCP